MSESKPITFGGVPLQAGQRKAVAIALAKLATDLQGREDRESVALQKLAEECRELLRK